MNHSPPTFETWCATPRFMQGPHGQIAFWTGGEGRPLLLIHGFPTASWDWSRLWQPLINSGRQLIALDMLGFGLSDKPANHTYNMMDQAEVTASEKYRRVMEAYQGELEFGRTTEAYSAKLPGTEQTVDFLRVGRTLLVYQTSDQETTGWFNPATRAYEELPDRYRLEVKKGLSIARNEKAPDLVTLPVPGPEVAQ